MNKVNNFQIAKVQPQNVDQSLLPSKTDRSIKYLTVLENLCIFTQDKTWIDERLMMVLYKKIWLRYVRKIAKEIVFHKSLMVMVAFKAHSTDYVAEALLISHTGTVRVPAGCTAIRRMYQQTPQIYPRDC